HKLAEPLLSGVYNADPDQQSILATFPNFRKIEAEHGSLIRGMRKITSHTANTPIESPALVSFKRGMGQFIDALVSQLNADLRLNTRVTRLAKNGEHWRLTLDSGETLDADAVILATPAP